MASVVASTLLRVKRPRTADPVDALLVSCKRRRCQQLSLVSDLRPVQQQLFRLAATVSSQVRQEEALGNPVRDVLRNQRACHFRRPGSGNRIALAAAPLRKQSARASCQASSRAGRYRAVASFRSLAEGPEELDGVPDGEGVEKKDLDPGVRLDGSLQPSDVTEEVKEFFRFLDVVHEEEEDSCGGKREMSLGSGCPGTDDVLCNSVRMVRELAISGVGSGHRDSGDVYVYDIYYSATPGVSDAEDVLSVMPLNAWDDLIFDVEEGMEEAYEDEDDENEESNWRNDYPDENCEDEGSSAYDSDGSNDGGSSDTERRPGRESCALFGQDWHGGLVTWTRL
uniref:probable RNA polymerase II nuclear localization protein SLC7A6OS isoform X2 n=1 Tax=Myxine glutinosa TaxID=7769 RepID=UPI00358FABA4